MVRAGVHDDAQEAFRFVKANHAMHPAAVMCRALGVSESGYHAWRIRPPSRRARRDAELTALIRAAHEESNGSRRIVGWAMATHLRTEVVLDALNMAVTQRRPANVVHHSDQGCQYTSVAFGKRCREAGVRPSMGSVGDAYDNAMCESFFASLECELLQRTTLHTQTEGRMAVFQYIEGWYNTRRRHSGLDYQSPIGYERKHLAAA